MPPAKKDAPALDVEAQVETQAAAAGDGAPAEAHDEAANAPAEAAVDAAEAAPEAAEAPDVPRGLAVMRHPDDENAGASHAGQSYAVDIDGYLIVPLAAVEPLKSHGFVLVKGA